MEAVPFTVPVAGGDLHVWRYGNSGPVVVLVHGITANHVSWVKVARALAQEAVVLVPDLRGRGWSNGLPGPFSMHAHADDLVALLDHFDVDRAVLVGHSMGGWVVTNTAVDHPERVHRLVIIDGGIAIPVAGDVSITDALHAVLGPSMARLAMTFPTRAAYHEFWQAHPSVGGRYWDDDAVAYIDHDLIGEEPELRSSVALAAVEGDATSQLTDPAARDAIEHIRCPAVLLRAERGLLDGDPLYPDATINALRERWPNVVSDEVVADTNHFSIVLGSGAPTVTARIREAIN